MTPSFVASARRLVLGGLSWHIRIKCHLGRLIEKAELPFLGFFTFLTGCFAALLILVIAAVALLLVYSFLVYGIIPGILKLLA